MAGIVASTLRRRTFRQKLPGDGRYQAIEGGHPQSLSPTGSHPPSRSPSFIKSMTRSPSGHAVPKSTKLFYQDFWPTCVNPLEQNLRLIEFETFEWVQLFCQKPVTIYLKSKQLLPLGFAVMQKTVTAYLKTKQLLSFVFALMKFDFVLVTHGGVSKISLILDPTDSWA